MICKTFPIITENQQVLQRRAVLVNVFTSLSGTKQLKQLNLLISGRTFSTDYSSRVESGTNLLVAQ